METECAPPPLSVTEGEERDAAPLRGGLAGTAQTVRVLDVPDGGTLVVLAETVPGRMRSIRCGVRVCDGPGEEEGGQGRLTTPCDPSSLEMAWAARDRLVHLVTGGAVVLDTGGVRGDVGSIRAARRAIRRALASHTYLVRTDQTHPFTFT